MHNRESIVDALNAGIVEVKFTKVDGSSRTMRCTLSEKFLPPHDSEAKARASNEAVVAVWDVDAGGWRSFRVDTVESIQPVAQVLYG